MEALPYSVEMLCYSFVSLSCCLRRAIVIDLERLYSTCAGSAGSSSSSSDSESAGEVGSKDDGATSGAANSASSPSSRPPTCNCCIAGHLIS